MSKLTQSLVTKTLTAQLTRVGTMNHRPVVPTEPTELNPTELLGAMAECPSKENTASNIAVTEEAVEKGDKVANAALVDESIEVLAEKLDGRRRQITATVQIPYSIENVWNILTDYERLAEFIPSLKRSRRIDHPGDGIRIEQIGSESLLKIKFCARVVLDMFEAFPHSLGFEMVEGDFKMFCGEWQLHPVCDGTATRLTYTLRVWPSRLMPVGMVEKRLSQGLQVNLTAIQQRADELFG